MSLNGKLESHNNEIHLDSGTISSGHRTMRPYQIAGKFNKYYMLQDKLRPEIKQCVAQAGCLGTARSQLQPGSFDNKMLLLERNLQE